MPQSTQTAFGVAALSASTAVAAGVTIAHRMMLLADPSALGAATNRAEAMRMVSEKVDAVAEGSLDAAFEAGHFVMRSLFGSVWPDDIAHGLMAIGMAAAKPAARRASANARRLSRA
jgi:hypothetical protein